MTSFEEKIEIAVQDGTIPGVVLAATNSSGTFRYQKAFGKSDLNYELDTPMKLMSCTKLITSIAVLQCVEKGLIGLDDDVSKHLTTLPNKILLSYDEGKEPVLEDRRKPVTLRTLITHSAGTPNVVPNTPSDRYRTLSTGKTDPALSAPTVEGRFGVPQTFQPGEAWEYGAGHDWAAKVVEAVTDLDLENYIKQNIAPQLGITTMTFWPQKNGLMERVPITMIRENTDSLKGMFSGRYDPMAKLIPLPHTEWDDVYKKTDCFGGSGLTCTAPDYLKVLHSLLANDEKLLKLETVQQLLTPQLTPEAKKSLNDKWFNLGWSSIVPGAYDEKVELDWGLGAMLTLGESEGWRSKGTLTWSGFTNLFWFVDRTKDVCGIFATQILPTGDDRVKEVIKAWEIEMHRLAAAVDKA